MLSEHSTSLHVKPLCSKDDLVTRAAVDRRIAEVNHMSYWLDHCARRSDWQESGCQLARH